MCCTRTVYRLQDAYSPGCITNFNSLEESIFLESKVTFLYHSGSVVGLPKTKMGKLKKEGMSVYSVPCR